MPFAVGVDLSGNVYVSDTNNSRILEYNNSAPNPTNAAPNLVLGQSTFTGSVCGGATGVTAYAPRARLSFDTSNNLYVADRSDNRVLEYFTPLTATGVPGSGDKTADVVLGEPGFHLRGPLRLRDPVGRRNMCPQWLGPGLGGERLYR